MGGRNKSARKPPVKGRNSSKALSGNRPSQAPPAKTSRPKHSSADQDKNSRGNRAKDEDEDDDEESELDSDDYSSVSVDDLPPIRAYGHTYHGSGMILTPNDESERQRLAVQHELFKVCQNGALTVTKLPRDRPLKMLDVGTGSGVWALEMGQQYPHAHVMGIDISAAMLPTSVPRNVVFEIEDANEPWGRPRNSLDFVYLRNLTGGGVRDWGRLAEQAYQVLKPGGSVEFADLRLRLFDVDESDGEGDGSPRPKSPAAGEIGAAFREFDTVFHQTAEKIGLDIDPMPKIPVILTNLGFEKVMETTDMFPIRPWGNDEKMQTKGALGKALAEIGEARRQIVIAGCSQRVRDRKLHHGHVRGRRLQGGRYTGHAGQGQGRDGGPGPQGLRTNVGSFLCPAASRRQ